VHTHARSPTMINAYSVRLDFGGGKFPPPFPFRPLSFLFPPFPLLWSRPPLRLRGWGAHKLSQRVCLDPGRQIFWCIWGINVAVDCLMTNNFLCLLSIERLFPCIFVIRCHGPKIDLEHTFWPSFGGGNCKFFWWGESPQKMSGRNTGNSLFAF